MESFTIWRTYSIFISSTFIDMQAERDYLKNTIFPRIEEVLRKRRIKLDVIDLRWGVDTTSVQNEDDRESTVLKVCLEEIKKSKPYFIGLLGDRYGWVPAEERMKEVVEENGAKIKSKGKSVTALEIEFGVLASKEQLKRSFFYFRKPLDYEKITEAKRVMFCDEYNDKLTIAEKAERKEALNNLKKDIRNYFLEVRTPEKVKEYSLEWDENKKEDTGLIKFGELVYKDILKDVEIYAEFTWNDIPKTWEEREQAILDEFIADHTYAFCGRTKLLDESRQHLLSSNSQNWGLVLTGESGSGKSSVFSKIYRDLLEQNENYFVLAHSAGVSPRSKNLVDLLQLWIKQLREFLKYEGNSSENFTREDTSQLTTPEFDEKGKQKLKIEELQEKFTSLLFKAADRKRVIILIDALDKFESTPWAKSMSWFPTIVHQNIRLLCTAITGTEHNAVDYHKGLTKKNIDHFSPEEAKVMLATICRLGHKEVPQKVTTVILAKKRENGLSASSSPLWLSLAVNIMMALDKDDFEKMNELEGRGDSIIENYLVDMVNKFPSLPGELFISLINKACILLGENFTNAVFDSIAISRNGLREKDLENLLPGKINTKWDPLQYAMLRRWFRTHLIKQGEELQWNLAHSILRNALKERMNKDEYKNMNGLIACYLLKQPNTDALRITETMYHLMEADKKQTAAEYYGSELSDEEIANATKVLAEAIVSDEDKEPNPYIKWTTDLFTETILDAKIKSKVVERIQFPLYDALETEGNINERLILLQNILSAQIQKYDDKLCDYSETFDLAISYERLGELFQTIGQLDKALDFFEKYTRLAEGLCDTNPDNKQLQNSMAVSYERLGSLSQTMGQFDRALEFYQKYRGLNEELYKLNLNDEVIKQNLAISYERLGDLFKTMGQLDKALDFFEKSNKLAEELYRTNQKNEGFTINLSVSYERLGGLFQIFGWFDKALEFFEKSSKLNQGLYKANPKNEGLKNGLAISYSKLGKLFQAMGQLEKALDFFEKYRQFNEELYKTNPNNEGIKNSLAISYEKLGGLYKTMGQLEKALDFYEKETDLFEDLYKTNPKNEGLKNGLAISYENLGGLFQTIGQLDKALNFFEKYRQFNEELHKSNPKNEGLREHLAISYSKLGILFKTIGQPEKALNLFEKEINLLEELNKVNPKNEGVKNNLAVSYSNLGGLFKIMGKYDKALDSFEKYLRLAEELYKENPNNELLKQNLAISYERLGGLFKTIGKLDKALDFYEKETDLFEELYNGNPKNEGLKNGLAISYENLGGLFQTIGHLDKALNSFEKSNKLTEELYRANPMNEGLKNGFAILNGRLGDLFQTTGQLDKALNFFEKSSKLGEELQIANPKNEEIKNNLTVSYERLGDLLQIMGQLDKALEFFKKSSKLGEELHYANPDNINLFEGLGISYYKLGILYITMRKDKEGKEYLQKFRSILIKLFADTKILQYKEWLEQIKVDYGID